MRLVGVLASRLCFVVVALLIARSPARAGASTPAISPWTMRVWRSDDGLPNNHVTGLAQTPDGYLWVATYSAPTRFDGVRFEEFLPKDLGVGANQKISALSLARDGGLWLGTIHGAVARLDAHGVALFGDGLPYKPVEKIVEDPHGALWLVHQGGSVARFQNGKLTVFNRNDGLPFADAPTRYVCSLALDARGELWFGKDGQVGVVRDRRFRTLLQLAPLNLCLGRASQGGMWIASDGQLFSFAEDRPAVALGRFTDHATHPTALLEDSAGAVWIGTSDAGLFRYDATGSFQAIPTSDHRISSLAEDRKGNIWVGTVGGGLNQIVPRLVTLENDATGLPTGVLQSLAEDATGTVWATTQSGLLLRRAESGWQTISAGPKWPGGRAAALAVDATGALWIGTRDRALHRWKDGVFTSLRRNDGLAGREIHALVPARNGDLWIGLSSPDIVQRLRDGKLETFPMPENTRVIRAMAEDTLGNLWVGSSRGMLFRIRDGVVTDETRRSTGDPLSIRTLRATADGAVWIGYADDGVGLWKAGRFSRVSTAHGFPEANVSQILPDGAGWLWFAGDHGVFKVREAALEAFAQGRTERTHFIRYGRSEGLYSAEANFGDTPGALRTHDGRLWIPLRTALAVVDPRQTRADPEPPSVFLKRVLVDDAVVAAYGHSVPMRGAIDLAVGGALRPDSSAPGDRSGHKAPPTSLRVRPGHFRLTFEFAALTFRAPENARFRYRLQGFDADWIDAGTDRRATYSRLPAAAYHFHVQACNGDGVWNEAGSTLAFAVAPFWWQTWSFRVAATTALIAAIVVLVRQILLRRVRAKLHRLEQQAAVHKERTRIARDLHDEFGTRLTELGLIAELEHRGARSNDVELIGHIRALERDLDTIVWTVNPKNDTLDQLLGFVCRVNSDFLARSGIRCRLDLPDDLPARPVSPELRHNVFLAVREAVTNVVKHAGATRVKLAVALDGDTLRIRLEDDGSGFAVAAAEGGERNGLKNMRARIEELAGKFCIESHPANGTRIELRVPLGPISWDRDRPRSHSHSLP